MLAILGQLLAATCSALWTSPAPTDSSPAKIMELARLPSLSIAVADLDVRVLLFGPVVFVAVPMAQWLKETTIGTIFLLVRRFDVR